MNVARVLRTEIVLLWRSLFAKSVLALTAAFAVLGMEAVDNSNEMQFHGMGRTARTMSLGAAQYGAFAGAALFAMLTLLVLSRDRRQRSWALIEAAAESTGVLVRRVAALLLLALATVLAALLATALAHQWLASAVSEWGPYLFSLGLILAPALAIAILTSAALEIVFEDLDVSFLAFGAFYFFGFSSPGYLERWIQTPASVYSDFAGIEPVGRLILYNRLFWACSTAAILAVGLWLRRHPGASFGVSWARNSRRAWIPAMALAASLAAFWVAAREPHLFTADSVFQRNLPRSTEAWLDGVDFTARLLPARHALESQVRYRFAKQSAATSVEFIVNAGLAIDEITVNRQPGAWRRVPGTDRLRIDLPAGLQAEVSWRYGGRIKYPAATGLAGYISGQSVYLLENSHWLPEPLVKAPHTFEVAGAISAPASWSVVAPGRTSASLQNGAEKTWHFALNCRELSLGVFAADYVCKTFEVNGAKVEFYYSPRHAAAIETSGVARQIADILSFYHERLGALPFAGMPLCIVETSVYKPGGHASLNVVTLAEYLLNRTGSTDPNRHPGYVLRDQKILAHELAHLWWGGEVTIADARAWSAEGLAEYMAYRFLAARYPEGITENIIRGWHGTVVGQTNAYYQRDPAAWRRMRPAMRERLGRDRAKAEAYSSLPLQLVTCERRDNTTDLLPKLGKLFQAHRGSALAWPEFVAGMAPEFHTPEGGPP